MSTITAYAPRTTVPPSFDGFQIAPTRGCRLWPVWYGLARLHERVGGRVEHHEAALRLGRRHDAVVAKAEIERQIVDDARKLSCTNRPSAFCRTFAGRSPSVIDEVVAQAGLERREAAELERAGVGREVVVHDAAELAADLDATDCPRR